MTKIKFGILGGIAASLITISPSFGAVVMLQGTSLDLQGTVNEDAVITFMNNGAEIRKDGSFNMETGDALKLVAGKSKGVIVEHNVLLFNDKAADVIKYGDPKIDFKQGGSVITAEGNGLGVESDGVVKLISSNVRIDHNLLSFVADSRYPTPTINFGLQGAKLTAADGLQVEGDKGLTISGPLTVTGTQTMTGNQHVTGTLQVDGASTLAAVSSAGTIDFTGAISLGNNTSTVAVNSTSWDVSTAGALTGLTGITMASGNFGQTGAGTFGTGTGAVSLNGDTTMASGKTFAAKGITNSGVYTQSGTDANTFTGATAFSPTLNSVSTVVTGTTGTPATAFKVVQPGSAVGMWIDGTATSATIQELLLVQNDSATLTSTDGIKINNAAGNITTGLELAGTIGTDIKLQNGETIDNAVNGTVLITAPITKASAALTADGVITGNLGLTVTGAPIYINDTSNYNTYINTGTSAGNVFIGGSIGKTIDIAGTGAIGADTIDIGTGGTAADIIHIGDAAVANTITIGNAAATTVSIADDNWAVAADGAAHFASVGASSPGTGAFTTLTSSGALTNTGTTDIGWSVKSSVAACNTTCTSGCVFGQLSNFAIVACTDAAATTCVCAGAN